MAPDAAAASPLRVQRLVVGAARAPRQHRRVAQPHARLGPPPRRAGRAVRGVRRRAPASRGARRRAPAPPGRRASCAARSAAPGARRRASCSPICSRSSKPGRRRATPSPTTSTSSPQPVDATAIPHAIAGGRARVIINSFHHFPPELARVDLARRGRRARPASSSPSRGIAIRCASPRSSPSGCRRSSPIRCSRRARSRWSRRC